MRRFLFFLLAICMARVGSAQSGVRFLVRPDEGYVLDQAHLLSGDSIDKINQISANSDRLAHAPIFVVTVNSLSEVGSYDIETYARQLHRAWRIGQ